MVTGIIDVVNDAKQLAENPSVEGVVKLLGSLGNGVKEIAAMFTDDENVLKLLSGVDKLLDGTAEIVSAAHAMSNK